MKELHQVQIILNQLKVPLVFTLAQVMKLKISLLSYIKM